MGLALLGLGLAAVFQLVNMQAMTQAKAQLQMEALREAQNLMDRWLDEPKLRPGSLQGTTASGMAWRVTVRRVAGAAPKAKPKPGKGTTRSSLTRPTSRRLPVLLEIAVCCSYDLMGRTGRACLVSQRLGEGEL